MTVNIAVLKPGSVPEFKLELSDGKIPQNTKPEKPSPLASHHLCTFYRRIYKMKNRPLEVLLCSVSLAVPRSLNGNLPALEEDDELLLAL